MIRHRRARRRLLRLAQERDALLSLVVKDHVEHTVAVEVDETDRLRVEVLAVETELRREVLECAVAAIAEVAVGALQAADNEVEMAVVVDIAPGSAGRPRNRLRER